MKTILCSLIFISTICLSQAKTQGNLAIYGIINSVKITQDDVSIEFTGIANLTMNDPSLKDQNQSLSLAHTVIHLKFDHEPKGMHTYSKFRYLDWIDEKQAIALLKEFQKNSSEVALNLNAESLAYSLSENNSLKATSLTTTLHQISIWKNLYEESISEFSKNMDIDYNLVQKQQQSVK